MHAAESVPMKRMKALHMALSDIYPRRVLPNAVWSECSLEKESEA